MKPLPVASLVCVVIGAVMTYDSDNYLWISLPLLIIGMIGCFVSIVKYRKG
jgi:energy-converting hydrogenase Eha subunit C